MLGVVLIGVTARIARRRLTGGRGLLPRRLLTGRLLARWLLARGLLARGLLARGLLARRLLTRGLLAWWLLARGLFPGRRLSRRLLAGRRCSVLRRLLRILRRLLLRTLLLLVVRLIALIVLIVLRIRRRRIFLQLVDFALHEIAVVLGVGIIGAQLQRGVVRLDRLFPGLQRLLLRALQGPLSGAVQRVAQVVIGVLLLRQALGVPRHRAADRRLKRLRRLRKLSGAVGGGANVELQRRRLRVALRGRGVLARGRGEIALVISLLSARGRCTCRAGPW